MSRFPYLGSMFCLDQVSSHFMEQIEQLTQIAQVLIKIFLKIYRAKTCFPDLCPYTSKD